MDEIIVKIIDSPFCWGALNPLKDPLGITALAKQLQGLIYTSEHLYELFIMLSYSSAFPSKYDITSVCISGDSNVEIVAFPLGIWGHVDISFPNLIFSLKFL